MYLPRSEAKWTVFWNILTDITTTPTIITKFINLNHAHKKFQNCDIVISVSKLQIVQCMRGVCALQSSSSMMQLTIMRVKRFTRSS